MYLEIVLKSSLLENSMTYFSPNIPPKPIHPLDILDQSHSGYIIDIIENFKGILNGDLIAKACVPFFYLWRAISQH